MTYAKTLYCSPDMQLQHIFKVSCAVPSLAGIWAYYNNIPLLRMPAPFLAVQQDPGLGEWNLKCENILEMFGKSCFFFFFLERVPIINC